MQWSNAKHPITLGTLVSLLFYFFSPTGNKEYLLIAMVFNFCRNRVGLFWSLHSSSSRLKFGNGFDFSDSISLSSKDREVP